MIDARLTWIWRWGALACAGLLALAAPAAAIEGFPAPTEHTVLPAEGICTDSDRPVDRMHTVTARLAVRCLVNFERDLYGRERLRPDGRLNRAAEQHALDMAQNGFFGHVSSTGERLRERLDGVARPRGWRWVGEVLGWACNEHATPRAIVDAWMRSRPHRLILMARRARTIGIGAVTGTPFACPGATWTLELGTTA